MKIKAIQYSLILFTIAFGLNAASVEDTVSKARNHLGGDAALDAIDSIQYRGKISIYQGVDAEGNDLGYLEGGLVMSFKAPYFENLEFIFEDHKRVTVTDRMFGAEYNEIETEDGTPVRNIRRIGGEEFVRTRSSVVENVSFFKPEKFSNAVEIKDKGMTTVDGQQAHQIDYVYYDTIVFSRYIDASTGDLLQTVLDTGMVSKEEGEIVVGGVKFPKSISGIKDDKVIYTMTYDEIIINPELDDSLFEIPM